MSNLIDDDEFIVDGVGNVLTATAARGSGKTGHELGHSLDIAYHDFHSGSPKADFDARIACTDGDGTPGGGTLAFEAKDLQVRCTSLNATITASAPSSTNRGVDYADNRWVTGTCNLDATAGGGIFSRQSLFVTSSFGGTAMKGGRNNIESILIQTAATSVDNSTRFYVGSCSWVWSRSGDGGSARAVGAAADDFSTYLGAYFGSNPFVKLVPESGTSFEDDIYIDDACGSEVNIFAARGVHARLRSGVRVATESRFHGEEADGAFTLTSLGGDESLSGWKNGFLVTTANGRKNPIDPAGAVHKIEDPCEVGVTIARGIDFSAATFTDKLICFQDFAVDNDGGVFIGSPTTASPGTGHEVSRGSGIAYHDFHSGDDWCDYDARIGCTGGDGSPGGGTVNIEAGHLSINGVRIDQLEASATFISPPTVEHGACFHLDVAVPGAELGDFVQASLSVDAQGLLITAHVKEAGTVRVMYGNLTGEAVCLTQHVGRVRVTKKS